MRPARRTSAPAMLQYRTKASVLSFGPACTVLFTQFDNTIYCCGAGTHLLHKKADIDSDARRARLQPLASRACFSQTRGPDERRYANSTQVIWELLDKGIFTESPPVPPNRQARTLSLH